MMMLRWLLSRLGGCRRCHSPAAWEEAGRWVGDMLRRWERLLPDEHRATCRSLYQSLSDDPCTGNPKLLRHAWRDDANV